LCLDSSKPFSFAMRFLVWIAVGRTFITAFVPYKQSTGCGSTAFSSSACCLQQVSTPDATTTCKNKEQRAIKAKKTWQTIALQPTKNIIESISMAEASTIHNPDLFQNFMSTKGTYYLNGLASCQVGDRIMHPFEAHGHCKSMVFDGQGSLHLTSHLIETPLTQKEIQTNQPVARGVMSTLADPTTLWGMLQNALSPTERDTANLVASLWPPPSEATGITTNPLLITCTDNGEPYVLDPKTLKTKGKLTEVVPKLGSILDGKKCLAHTRYDPVRKHWILCVNEMDIPGENYMGNSTMIFYELDINFDVVSSRSYTTRFMVFHDWVITENYYVVPQNPARIKWAELGKFLLGATVGTDIFGMEEATNGAFLLIPRHDPNQPVRVVETDAFFNLFHFGPCFEKDNAIVLHGSVFDRYEFGGEMGFDGPTQTFDPIAWGSSGGKAPPPRLDKFVIDSTTFELTAKTRIPIVDPFSGQDIPVDMPTFRGDAIECRYAYFLGACRPEGWFPFRSIVKLDLETYETHNWDAGEGQVVSEPMWVPKSSEENKLDEGFVLSVVHDAETKSCRLNVWDAVTFDQGPIASVPLGALTPWCVHGSWTPEYNPGKIS
jgi:carotenoid cleavage dioxygenase-like enzyme